MGESRQLGNLVVDVVCAWAWTDFSATTSNPLTGITSSAKTSIKSLASLTPKLGYAIGGRLPYAKAGLALAEVQAALSGTNHILATLPVPAYPVGSPIGFDRKHLLAGWTAGLGVEYNYYQFSGKTHGGLATPDISQPQRRQPRSYLSTR